MFLLAQFQSTDVQKLQDLLKKQANTYGNIGSNYVVQYPSTRTRQFRTECAYRIRALHYFYGGSPGSFAVAIGIVDFFLWGAKVSEKHLGCLSAACYLIGSKLMEDDSPVCVSELRTLHFNQWTEADLRRMEKWVLRQLNWRVPMCTYLPFLQLFSKVPSSLALGVIQHCLQTSGSSSMAATTTIMYLQNIIQVCDSELYECCCILSQKQRDNTSTRHVLKPDFPLKLRYRPAWEGSSELQTITEERNTSDGEANHRILRDLSACHVTNNNIEDLSLSQRSHNVDSVTRSSSCCNEGDGDECESDTSYSTSDSESAEFCDHVMSVISFDCVTCRV
ncbi:hypothetical protein BaRGS_00012167 [Batillaria attramentaria]|uniref:Cyclin N-terminal domain-containing protein n=1 Tax=Batillaria attramentaria TaxID=370345 RepID=A0ABD0LAZ5_9CAEN